MCVKISDNIVNNGLYNVDMVVWYVQFDIVGLQCCGKVVVKYVEDYYFVDVG